jgi:mannose-6-phosphate isomerase-like protein (cupin superfamily)
MEVTMPVLSAPESPTHQVGDTSFTSLATPSRGTRRTSVWLLELAAGARPTTHLITEEEVFVVLDGTADVELAGRPSKATTGDAIVVPAGVPFALGNVGPGVCRLVCCQPVGGQAQLLNGEPFTPPWAL